MSGSDNKQIAKNTLILYFRMILLMCISLYTSRIVLAKLGISDYGIYNVVGGVISLLSFLNGAMSTTNLRFFSFELGRKDPIKLRLVFSQSIIVHLSIGILFVIFAETIGLWFVTEKLVIPEESRTAAMWVYQSMIIQSFLSVYSVPFSAIIVAHEKMNIFAVLGIVEGVLKLVIAILIGWFSSNRLIVFAIFMLMQSLLITFSYVSFGRRNFDECKFELSFDIKVLKELTSFAGWSLFGSIAWIAKFQGVNIVLNTFFGTIVNAAFGVANQVNAAVSKFVQNFSTALNPQIIKTFASGDTADFNLVVERGSRWAFLLLYALAFPVMVNIHTLLHLWLVDVPNYAEIFSVLFLSVSLLESFTYPIGTAIQATGKIKWYQIIVGVTLFMNVPFSWLVLRLGGNAPAVLIVANIIALIALAERLLIMKSVIPTFSILKFSRQVFVRPIFVAISSFGAYFTLNYFKPQILSNIWLNLLVSLILGLIVSVFVGLTRNEISATKSFLHNKIKTIHG